MSPPSSPYRISGFSRQTRQAHHQHTAGRGSQTRALPLRLLGRPDGPAQMKIVVSYSYPTCTRQRMQPFVTPALHPTTPRIALRRFIVASRRLLLRPTAWHARRSPPAPACGTGKASPLGACVNSSRCCHTLLCLFSPLSGRRSSASSLSLSAGLFLALYPAVAIVAYGKSPLSPVPGPDGESLLAVGAKGPLPPGTS